MATRAVLQVGLALEESPASLAAELAAISNDRTSVLKFVERLISRIGHRGHKLAVRVDSAADGSTNFALQRMTRTNTIVQASLVDNTDTLTFGGTSGVVFTWKTSPSGENEVAIGASDSAAATNLAAKINEHSELKGIVTASAALGVVTITWCGDPRIGRFVSLTEVGNGQTLSGNDFALDNTDAYASASYLFSDGGLR